MIQIHLGHKFRTQTSRVLEPSQPVVIIEAGGEQRAGMESSPEITEVEDDPLSGMESSQIPTEITEVEDDPLSGTKSRDAFSRAKVNPFVKHFFKVKKDEKVEEDEKVKGEKKALRKHLDKLKMHLTNDIKIETMSKFMDDNDMTGAQEKVEELFNLCEAFELLMENRGTDLKPMHRDWLKKNCYNRIDIYYDLFMHALGYKKESKVNVLLHYEATDFMVFLINKVQGEEDILIPTLVPQDTNWTKRNLITVCVRMHEEEMISVFICHVLKDEHDKAVDLFKSLVNPFKPCDISKEFIQSDNIKEINPSDIINCGRLYNYALERGRLYNYALERAEDLFEVHKFLTSEQLSQRYRNVVQGIDQLYSLALKDNNRVKVHNFLVNNLYLKDVEKMPNVMKLIDWAFAEQHNYPYLVKCVLAHCQMMKSDASQYNWTEVKVSVSYAFTSSAAIGGLDTMDVLLQMWPELDVNASYKSVTALHIAAYIGNEKLVDYLLKREKLDINLRTGRLLKADNGKKNNTNWWNLSTHQTALHIATARGHAHVVKILCDPPEPHQQRMRCHEEDEEEHTPLDILYAKVIEAGGDFENGPSSLSQIEKILLSNKDVQSGIDRLYRNRQVLVDAANTILVGAALIAGVAFAGWLQPPLGYAQYYDLATPYPAPAGTYDSYIGVQGNMGIKAFALFNSLSFFFAIATIIVAADAAFPI